MLLIDKKSLLDLVENNEWTHNESPDKWEKWECKTSEGVSYVFYLEIVKSKPKHEIRAQMQINEFSILWFFVNGQPFRVHNVIKELRENSK
jgi:hypothetical protein